MIPVTRPYLPSRERLDKYLDSIYERAWLTNNGPLVQLLTERLKAYLGVEHLLLVSNGTLALQVAYRALDIKGEAITTPFSFVATTSSLQWEGIKPVFGDIEPRTLCLNPATIEPLVTRHTGAIVPVHVYGTACEVEQVERIAAKHRLKVVYDGAHVFGVRYKGKSLLSFGDATTLSFHATKLFHTIEGGAIVFRDKAAYERAALLINFGIAGPGAVQALGINAKMSEFQAAMGLCVLEDIETILEQRREVWEHYERVLGGRLQFPARNPAGTNNYGYFPVLFENEAALLHAQEVLEINGVTTRRYFYPSLDTLEYVQPVKPAQVSRNVANRVLCLPIYPGLDPAAVTSIVGWYPFDLLNSKAR